MADPELTLQEIVKRRQQAGFVGRESQLAWFGENLALPVDSDRRRFIVNIHGDAGVGKTFLTEQFRRMAAEHGAVCAVVNEDTFDVPTVMAQVARDLGRDGAHLSAFDEEFSLYERRRRALVSDP